MRPHNFLWPAGASTTTPQSSSAIRREWMTKLAPNISTSKICPLTELPSWHRMHHFKLMFMSSSVRLFCANLPITIFMHPWACQLNQNTFLFWAAGASTTTPKSSWSAITEEWKAIIGSEHSPINNLSTDWVSELTPNASLNPNAYELHY